jgi:fibronectin type 3 domain-containing protein
MNRIGLDGKGKKIRRGGIASLLVSALFVLMGFPISRAIAQSGTVLAYEPFGESGTTPFALNGASGGGDQGWAAGWVEQSGSTTVPGYNIVSTSALSYTGLLTTTDHASGGYGYQSAGRALNVTTSGPFASYLSGGLIGASGQSIWISFLVRQDASGATPVVGLTAAGGSSPWQTNPANIQAGYFGSSSNDSSGNPWWSLQYNGSTIKSNVAVVTGQTVLFVIEDTFGSNGTADQINLYINPSSLGETAPSTPTLQYSPSASTAFQSITWYGGNSPNQGSLGDIRIGTSYSAVTPASASSAPAAPTGLTAMAGNGQASLSWTGSTGAASYNVYESTTSGEETSIATGITATTYTVTGLTNGTPYYFKVAAVNTAGTSALSSEASTTPEATLPSAPTGLTAAAGNGQVSLLWTASTGAASYNVYQGTSSGGEGTTPIATGVTSTTYAVTGLTNGTEYYFKVAAVNTAGTSALSSEASATPVLASGTVLAYEPFGETGTTPFALNGASGGGDQGWAAGWVEQAGSTTLPGYEIVSTSALSYTGLFTTADHASGGYGYQSAGRALNVATSGPFASYLSNGLIGAAGTSIWISFLVRQDTAGETPVVGLTAKGGSSPWQTSPANIQVGYFGSSSNDSSGNPWWSLQYNGSTIKSNVAVVTGQTVLFVIEDTFGSNGAADQINVYINPTSLGGTAPSTPALQYSPSASTAFQSITWYAADAPNQGSLGDIRIGTSYAAVTPASAGSAPAAPTGLSALAGSGAVSLSWNVATGATSYNVYEGTASGEESTTPIATGLTSLTYTVSGLTNGTTYYFKVAAVNVAGTSPLSSEASATPVLSVPSAPTGLTATAGSSQISLSWTASTGAASYNVYEGTSSNGETGTAIATGLTATTYTVIGLANGTTYYFKVVAVNTSGTSGFSNEASATPILANGALLAYEPFGETGTTPFALNGASGGGDQGWASGWVEQAGSTAVPGYNIVSTSALSYTGLFTTADHASGGYGYQSAGRALNVATSGPFASYLSGGLIDAAGQSIWISFVVRQDASGATPVVGLTAKGGSSPWQTSPANIQIGYFGSSSNDSSGNPWWSLQFSGTTVKSNVPVVTGQAVLFVVEDTFGSNGTLDQINLYINPSSLGGTAPSTPTLQYSPSGTTGFQSITWYGGDNPNESSLGDIRIGTSYSAVTPQQASPAAPIGLTASPGIGQVSLSWTASTMATSYNVYEGTSVGGESTTPIATGIASTTYTATGLTNGTPYYFKVAGVNTVGTGALSNEATATPELSVPFAPTGVTATAGSGQALLSWTASSGATSYNVYEGTSSGKESNTPIATGITSTTYSTTGLTNGTAYYFKVAAVNGAGTGGLSSEVSATPIQAPAGLSATAAIGQVSLSWTASAGATSYNVYESTTSGGEGSTPIITGITSTTYTATGLTNGIAYNFKVAGVNSTGTSSLSNEASATPIQSISGSLLAYEPFSETGTFALNGASGGGDQGWAAGWVEQTGSTAAPGYAIVTGSQLNYTGLFSDPNYASGGYGYQSAGRALNATLTGPFANYISNNLIGAPGQTIWISFLVRQDVSGATPVIGLTAKGGAVPWYTSPANIQVGYFGSSSNDSNGNPWWSLQYNGTTLRSNVPVVTGQVVLFVIEDTFGSNGAADQINLYIDPSSLGGTAPSTPTLQYSPSGSTAFQSITWYAADDPSQSSLGDIRIGNSYSAVTPQPSTPAAPTGLTATAGSGQVTVSWSVSSLATSYNVYVGTTPGGESSTPVATGIASTTYAVTGLTSGTPYYFKVAGVNQYGVSTLSSETTATPSSSGVGGTNSPSAFNISTTIVAPNPVTAGFNIEPAAGSANISENSWIADGGFSPYDARISFTASQDGTATTFIATGNGGTSVYSSIVAGYFVGAAARTYRYSSGAWSLLRTDTVTGYTANSASTAPADNTITFASSGPQILTGDIVWLDLDDVVAVPNISQFDTRIPAYTPTWVAETTGSTMTHGESTWPITLSTNVPSSDTGNNSLEITDQNSEANGIWQYIENAFVGPTDEEFQTNHTYEVDVWLMQSGIASGDVTFSISGLNLSHTFTGVTNQWQHFTWTFPAVGGISANSVQPSVHLDFQAPGTLWVDNFQLYDASWSPDTLSPQVVQAWNSFHPSVIRIWSNFANAAQGYSFLSLNSWLTPEIKTRNTPGIGSQYENRAQLEHLPDALANVKAVGASPWLIVNMALSEVEWGELIDYLAAPAGVGYASMRPSNHPGPYTDDFSTIYLEVGNEEWGTQQVPADAAYGQWANFVISQATASKSYFNSNQIKFIGNGFFLNPSFGSTAVQAAPQLSIVDYALYSSGNTSLTGDAYYQSDLVQLPATNGALIDAIVAQQQQDAQNGINYSLASYEQGPGSDTAQYAGDTSLAAAIGAIDVNLYASQRGFGMQNLFMYQVGTGAYTSHSNFASGFNPYPIWEALQMRNIYCSGPMVSTSTSTVPVTTDGNGYPLIAIYTFQDANVANQADVVVISRDLNNQTPVTLQFPATPTGTAQLDMLTGNPRANNDTAMNIPITSTSLTGVTANYTFTMPPGSMYIFQVPMSSAW